MLLYRYNIAVLPEVTGKKLSQVIRLLLELPEYSRHQDTIVTDFKSTLISYNRLSANVEESRVEYRAEGEDVPPPNAQTYRLRVEETGTLTVAELTDYLSSTNLSANYVDKQSTLQALNIFLGHYAKSNPSIVAVGKSKSFTPSSPKWDLGTGLHALRGFFSSVRIATCRILINVNVSHGAFYDAIPLDQLMKKHGIANLANLGSFLKRVRVQVIHLPEKKNKSGRTIPRVKTIFGLASKDDGEHLENPPRVTRFGAGSKDVEFFLSNTPPASSSKNQAGKAAGTGKKGKGGKGGADKQVIQGGEYISVYRYFETGIYSSLSLPFTDLTK